MYIETCDYDDDNRIIFRRREEDGLIEEWNYEYDSDGNQVVTMYYEEISHEGEMYSNYQ